MASARVPVQIVTEHWANLEGWCNGPRYLPAPFSNCSPSNSSRRSRSIWIALRAVVASSAQGLRSEASPKKSGSTSRTGPTRPIASQADSQASGRGNYHDGIRLSPGQIKWSVTAEPGKRDKRVVACAGSSKGRWEGKVHSTAAPCKNRPAPGQLYSPKKRQTLPR